jgi:HD-GYP domain-containing protein (c-di-GMP phosphodiesterase class II)
MRFRSPKQMGLGVEEIDALLFGGYLHDIEM